MYILFFKRFYLFIFRERGRGGEREGEKHNCVVASYKSPTGDLAHNPGICPDWESNRQPFGSQARAQSTELHQPGSFLFSWHSTWHWFCTSPFFSLCLHLSLLPDQTRTPSVLDQPRLGPCWADFSLPPLQPPHSWWWKMPWRRESSSIYLDNRYHSRSRVTRGLE